MTLTEYNERVRQLCNLVNSRRCQVGKEPLQAARIQRAVRLVMGEFSPPDPFLRFSHSPDSRELPIPYVLTEKALQR